MGVTYYQKAKASVCPVDPQSSRAAQVSFQLPAGKEIRPNFGNIDVTNLDSVYQRSLSLERDHPDRIADYFEHAEAIAAQDRQMQRMYGVPNHPYFGRPMTLLPMTGMMVEGISEMVQRVMRASKGFVEGLFEGLRTSLAKDPETLSRMNRNLMKSQILNVVLPAVMASGMVVGIVQDIVKAVTGLYQLVTNFDEIATAAVKLIKAILDDEKAAHGFGKLVGQQLGQKIGKLSRLGVIRFSFEVGRILGPIIASIAVAFTGIGVGALAVKFGREFLRWATRFPRIARLVDGLVTLGSKSGRGGKLIAYVTAAMASARSGITSRHVQVFQRVASSNGGQNRIIAVRFTNLKSTKWIDRGYPGKPMSVKVKTSDKTGIVTVQKHGPKTTPESHIQDAYSAGYYIVDGNGVARNKAGQALDLPSKTDWPLEPGQVIDPRLKKPLVGDYDLHSVIKPHNKGQNIVLATQDGKKVADASNPDLRKVAKALNDGMDQPRVLHGAHDGYAKLSDAGNGVVAFHPDGRIQIFNTVNEMEDFFESIGRQTIKGAYPSGPLPDVLPNNVLPLRRKD
ncbi:Anthrax toxin LF subunit [Planctomycetes bacterium CA13]|uniref:Anthrax toxin LF subunit n=1 Tax=Novipirellula herctigrandis TaxID=2527986 RepID=A0A5C5YYR7_9BACT|nr:Anthrax toxin LF subunit [Planctomycetes bacterium CA13]